MALAASLSLIQTWGKLIFVTALFGSHLFGLAMLLVRERREKQKIASNGEELDKITNQ